MVKLEHFFLKSLKLSDLLRKIVNNILLFLQYVGLLVIDSMTLNKTA